MLDVDAVSAACGAVDGVCRDWGGKVGFQCGAVGFGVVVVGRGEGGRFHDGGVGVVFGAVCVVVFRADDFDAAGGGAVCGLACNEEVDEVGGDADGG